MMLRIIDLARPMRSARKPNSNPPAAVASRVADITMPASDLSNPRSALTCLMTMANNMRSMMSSAQPR